MDLKSLGRGEAWMDDEEVLRSRDLARGLGKLFEVAGVVVSPLLYLRTEDLAISYLMVRRLEGQLEAPQGAEGEKGGPTLSAVVEGIGKARERMRKAMKELEDSCAKLGTPIDVGLADALRPIVEQARGVEEAALEAVDAEVGDGG